MKKILAGASLSLTAMLVLASCGLMKITPIDNPEARPKPLVLTGGVRIIPTGSVRMSGLIHSDFVPSSFRIESGKTVVYIDPFMVSDAKPADFVFITHSHMDHFSPEDIRKIAGKDTVIVCPKTVAGKLSGYQTMTVKPGDARDLGKVGFETVSSCSTKPAFLWFYSHPKADENTGFVITINGNRIYHVGDSYLLPEMKNIRNIDAVLVPIGTENTAMTPEEAAEMVNFMKPGAAVPMHYGLGQQTAKKFSELVNRQVRVAVLQPGE